jgi:hypothetical protein
MLDFIRTRNALRKAGELYSQKLAAQLKIDGTVATRKVLNSIRYKQSANTVSIFADKNIYFIDEGRKAGKPPSVSAILRWAEAKGIRPRGRNRAFKENTKSNRYWMAKNIAEAIGRNGTIKRFGGNGKGSDVISFVLNNNREGINRYVLEEYQKDLDAYLRQNVIKTN